MMPISTQTITKVELVLSPDAVLSYMRGDGLDMGYGATIKPHGDNFKVQWEDKEPTSQYLFEAVLERGQREGTEGERAETLALIDRYLANYRNEARVLQQLREDLMEGRHTDGNQVALPVRSAPEAVCGNCGVVPDYTEMLQAAEVRGEERERAKVIKHLRKSAERYGNGDYMDEADTCNVEAEEIEKGKHL